MPSGVVLAAMPVCHVLSLAIQNMAILSFGGTPGLICVSSTRMYSGSLTPVYHSTKYVQRHNIWSFVRAFADTANTDMKMTTVVMKNIFIHFIFVLIVHNKFLCKTSDPFSILSFFGSSFYT